LDLQFLHLPQRVMKESRGILSNHEILLLHFLQTDLPPIERPFGIRQIKTLIKEPNVKPRIKRINKNIKEDKTGSLRQHRDKW